MKRKLLRASIFLLHLTAIFQIDQIQAQKLFFIFGHVLYATPADNNFEHNYSSGLGVEGGAGLGSNRTFIVGTAGYTSFSSWPSNQYGSLAYVPLKLGIRHYLLAGKFLFVNADAGIGIMQNALYGGSRFSGDIGLGLKLGHFEVMANYDGFSRSSGETPGYSSWIGIKGGMTLGL